MNKEIEMLLDRWNYLSPIASIEQLYIEQYKFAQKNNISAPQIPLGIETHPVNHIKMIRNRLKELVPTWSKYDSDCELVEEMLNQNLIDIYMSHQKISIEKFKELLKINNA